MLTMIHQKAEQLRQNGKQKAKKNGFTLVEMLIVVGIILIIATIAVPKFTQTTSRAKDAKYYADIQTISGAVDLYRFDKDKIPTMEELVEEHYLQSAPKDPNNNDYAINKDTGVVSSTYTPETPASGSPIPKTSGTENQG